MAWRYGFKAVLAILGASLCLSQASASVSCETALTGTSVLTQETLDAAIHRLAQMRLDMEIALAARSPQQALLKSTYLAKESELQRFVESKQIMTKEELRQRMKEIITQTQNLRSEEKKDETIKRQEIKEEMKHSFNQKMIFNFIQPGEFRFFEDRENFYKATQITEPFAMMSTPVTQAMWALVKGASGEKDPAKISPSFHKEGALSMVINDVSVQIKADYPVEMIDRKEALEFVSQLNKFSNSEDPKIQELLLKLIPDHKSGDVYDLPTTAQWAFVVSNRGFNNKRYFDRNDDSEMANHAWGKENSGNETHEVATLAPRLIDGKPYFDLEGNVSQWLKDWHYSDTDSYDLGGKDPVGYTDLHEAFTFGTSFNDPLTKSTITSYSWSEDRTKDSGVGLRLIRKLPKPIVLLPPGSQSSSNPVFGTVKKIFKKFWGQ